MPEDGEPHAAESRFSAPTGDEQLYSRTYKIDGEAFLDTGWVTDVRMLCVEALDCDITLSAGAATFARVRRGESARFEPWSTVTVCGEGRIRVTAVPA